MWTTVINHCYQHNLHLFLPVNTMLSCPLTTLSTTNPLTQVRVSAVRFRPLDEGGRPTFWQKRRNYSERRNTYQNGRQVNEVYICFFIGPCQKVGFRPLITPISRGYPVDNHTPINRARKALTRKEHSQMLSAVPVTPKPVTCGLCEFSFEIVGQNTKDLVCCTMYETHVSRHQGSCPWYELLTKSQRTSAIECFVLDWIEAKKLVDSGDIRSMECIVRQRRHQTGRILSYADRHYKEDHGG